MIKVVVCCVGLIVIMICAGLYMLLLADRFNKSNREQRLEDEEQVKCIKKKVEREWV